MERPTRIEDHTRSIRRGYAAVCAWRALPSSESSVWIALADHVRQSVLTVTDKFMHQLHNFLLAVAAPPKWAEVRYIVERKGGLSGWLQVRARLLGLLLNIVPADQELSELASELKS